MTQIFVFTAGNPEARQHLVDSIENPVDEELVLGSFASAHREELERIREEVCVTLSVIRRKAWQNY